MYAPASLIVIACTNEMKPGSNRITNDIPTHILPMIIVFQPSFLKYCQLPLICSHYKYDPARYHNGDLRGTRDNVNMFQPLVRRSPSSFVVVLSYLRLAVDFYPKMIVNIS
ncbi:MAG: hypothetical protein ACR2IS_18450 [Nitrososphaeraceae archaeon]